MKIITTKFFLNIFILLSLSSFIINYHLNNKQLLRNLTDSDCTGESAYEPSDCFQIEFEYDESDNDKKCCFLEYKDKGKDNKKLRLCYELTYDEFLDIHKTIKDLKSKEENKNYTILSLECDKSSFLFFKKIFILITLIIL